MLKDSATFNRDQGRAIHADHYRRVKFNSDLDTGYKGISSTLKEMIGEVCGIIGKRNSVWRDRLSQLKSAFQ
ncbi:hypothetical protein BGZ61DRAFT_467506 [Ilyonectria robusta]|uniref:uncharacterized protein n=1 Tax=Ilyonectria robusta TaxID=1079257 RepID=UPI001E8D9684|nr:uncharacterized protein BGZ61DRAFT_467506 [Ilyonectria robusta]KAH8654732.1 hypothetical protein BGZ61DRAFT_467506 [Ilyonectria robusta]